MRIIAGTHSRLLLKSPKGMRTRPTSGRTRAAFFNICQNTIEGARFLDLCAGSGAMGFEALSRGAASVCFIDSSRDAVSCIKANARSLQVEGCCTILEGEWRFWIEKLEKKGELFDLIFADPPYGQLVERGIYMSEKIIRTVDTSPILAPGGLLFVEEDSACIHPLEGLSHLQLRDTRRFGRTAMQHYLSTQSEESV